MGRKSYWELREEQRREWERLSRTPLNKRLKYGAIGSVALAAVVMIVTLWITIEGESDAAFRATLILRIFAGVFALAGIVLLMALYYRVSKASLSSQWKKNN